ncbi:MAG TPA: hypothetical protein VFY21_10500 [Xanthobacteraceae bacterium]|nr:hypothetical protein [Xanthobacteraceae bacterium]
MQTSIYLAQLLGPCFLVVAAGLIINSDGYRAMAREFLKSRPLIYLAGLLAIAPGIAIVLAHNIWVADWRVLITIFGWLAAIGGAIRILFPQQVTEMGERMLDSRVGLLVPGVIVLLLGAVLSYYGYFA